MVVGRQNMKRAKIGSYLSAIGGILITLFSAEIFFIYNPRSISINYHPDVPRWQAILGNSLANSIDIYSLLFGILIVIGAVSSFSKDRQFAGGLVSVIFSGLSACLGLIIWLPPFRLTGVLGVDERWPLFSLGVALGVAGGAITIAASKHAAKMSLTTNPMKDKKALLSEQKKLFPPFFSLSKQVIALLHH